MYITSPTKSIHSQNTSQLICYRGRQGSLVSRADEIRFKFSESSTKFAAIAHERLNISKVQNQENKSPGNGTEFWISANDSNFIASTSSLVSVISLKVWQLQIFISCLSSERSSNWLNCANIRSLTGLITWLTSKKTANFDGVCRHSDVTYPIELVGYLQLQNRAYAAVHCRSHLSWHELKKSDVTYVGEQFIDTRLMFQRQFRSRNRLEELVARRGHFD